MVFFSCDGCAEVLKKSQVDGHAHRCRSCASVSCVDCLVSFYGDDYRSHTTCMTEVERYETKGRTVKKKQTPQEQWMELVNGAVARAPAHLHEHLQTIATLDNVPRKEKQFRNFCANSLKIRGRDAEKLLGEVWQVLQERRDAQKKKQAATCIHASPQSKPETEHQDTDGIDPSAPNPIQKVAENIVKATKASAPSNQLSRKTVKKAAKAVLLKAARQQMPAKDLRKAIRKQLHVNSIQKKQLKAILKNVLAEESDRFLVDGKLVTLQLKS